MKEWCMTHQWLTFWLAFLFFCLLDNMVANISKAIRRTDTAGAEHE